MSKAREFWNSSADSYDNTEERFEHIHRTSRDLARAHLKASDVVLDYGCGTGTTAIDLSPYVTQIRAIDISDRMIELANERATATKVTNVVFERGDLLDAEHDGITFDVILAFNMLHTLPDPLVALEGIHEMLKPGGTFVSVTPCLRDKMSLSVRLQIQLMRVMRRIGAIPIPIRRLRSSDLDALIGARFEITETTEIFAGASSYFVAAQKESPRGESSKPV